MADTTSFLDLTGEIVAAYVTRNAIAAADLRNVLSKDAVLSLGLAAHALAENL